MSNEIACVCVCEEEEEEEEEERFVADQAKSTGICPTVSGGNLALRRCSCAKYRRRTLHPL